MSTAYMFPGQGSQFVGMGKDRYASDEAFRSRVDHANVVLGYDLASIMFEGPEESLRQTENTQPAIFLHAIALFETLGVRPDMVGGHSLGEFTALVACGAVRFDDALRLVRLRGRLMQDAGMANPGTMAAVIGMADEQVEDICQRASKRVGRIVVPANYNATGQLVISGYVDAVDAAIEMLKEAGCRLAKKLPVSGAFHSPLMQPAFDGLMDGLEALEISKPVCPIYSNFTGSATTDPDTIRFNLLQQLMNPVRWTQTMQAMLAGGATRFVEVGPGSVLQGLVKRTLPETEVSGHS